jgi:hypothetical protein
MSRQKMRKKNIDAKVFKRTAKHIRKKNIEPKNMRGGIRL